MSTRARDKRAAERDRAGHTAEEASPARPDSRGGAEGLAAWRRTRLAVLARPLDADDPVLRWTAVWCLLSAAALHAAVAAPHYDEWALEGWFFVGLELAQVAVALTLAARPSRLVCVAGIAVNAGALLLWAVSRTGGVPLGPAAGEVGAIGRVDLVTAVFELVTIAVLTVVLTLRGQPSHARPLVVGGQVAVAGMAVAALTVYAVGGGVGHIDETADAETQTAASVEDERVDEPVGVPTDQAPAAGYGLDVAATAAGNDANRYDGDRFDADTLQVPAGASAVLRFTNDGSQRHNVSVSPVGEEDAPVFTGKVIDPSTTIAYPFTAPEPGTYRFQCDLHPWMEGTLRVT